LTIKLNNVSNPIPQYIDGGCMMSKRHGALCPLYMPLHPQT